MNGPTPPASNGGYGRLEERIEALRQRVTNLEAYRDRVAANRRAFVVLGIGAVLTSLGALTVTLISHFIF